MFIAAIFVRARNWNLSIDEWTSKMRSIHTMISYLAIKWNEIQYMLKYG